MGDKGKAALEYARTLAKEEVAFFKKASASANRWYVILRAVPIVAGIFSAILSVLAGTLKSPDTNPNVNLTITFGVVAAILTALTSAAATVLTGFKIGNWYSIRTEGLAKALNILHRAELALKTAEDDETAQRIANDLMKALERLRLKQQKAMADTMSTSETRQSIAPSSSNGSDDEVRAIEASEEGPVNAKSEEGTLAQVQKLAQEPVIEQPIEVNAQVATR